MRIWLGTGGFSNAEWHGLLYPHNAKPTQYLAEYAHAFDAVEINSTFYHIAGQKALAHMLETTQGRVQFCFKIHQAFTHSRDADAPLMQRMQQTADVLRQAGKLGPFLAQFPYSFARTSENRRYLAQLIAWFTQDTRFKEDRLAIEFRHASWHCEPVQAAFSAQGLIWASVDYPELNGLPSSGFITTGRVGYVRLHGRNTEQWWSGNSAAERHDYRYDDAELRDWAQVILAKQSKLDTVYVFFENTTKGHALYNAPVLRNLLQKGGAAIDQPMINEPAYWAKANSLDL